MVTKDIIKKHINDQIGLEKAHLTNMNPDKYTNHIDADHDKSKFNESINVFNQILVMLSKEKNAMSFIINMITNTETELEKLLDTRRGLRKKIELGESIDYVEYGKINGAISSWNNIRNYALKANSAMAKDDAVAKETK